MNLLLEAIKAGAFSLAVYHEDVGDEFAEAKQAQLTAIAVALEPAARAQKIARPAEWSALVLAIGDAESNFSLRIHRGECDWAKRECDAALLKGERVFRARGPWQTHQYGEARPTWEQMVGIENTAVQVRVASARLQRGYYTCRGGGDWFIATVNGYAGRRCSLVWPGLEKRYATYRRLVKVIDNEMARLRREQKS